jgi:hypothetical protein
MCGYHMISNRYFMKRRNCYFAIVLQLISPFSSIIDQLNKRTIYVNDILFAHKIIKKMLQETSINSLFASLKRLFSIRLFNICGATDVYIHIFGKRRN